MAPINEDDLRELGFPTLLDIIKTNSEVMRDMTAGSFGAIPEGDFCVRMNIPASTMAQLKREGKAPPTFKVGKRNYVNVAQARRWFDEMAGEVGA